MRYSELCEIYEELSLTSKRLEKVSILANFLKKLKSHGSSCWIYLLRGRVTPEYDMREFGISNQLVFKILEKSFAIPIDVLKEEFNSVGDFGKIAETFSKKKKQYTLYSSHLTIERVFNNLLKILSVEGRGSVEKKISLVAELLSCATPIEAKYIIRTVLSDLKIGVADSTIREAIVEAFFPNEKELIEKIDELYYFTNDFSFVFEAAIKGKNALENIEVVPGKPITVMLAVKATSIEDAFRICGKPAAIEHKYDGFRVIISKKNKEIKLFTRRLEDVTLQFPDIVERVNNYVSGESFILDSEAVGYDFKTKKYLPFQSISQRIKRKYDIVKLSKEMPVELNVFDILYYNGKSLVNLPFSERRKIVEKIVKKIKLKIRPAVQIITDDEEEAEDFYKRALEIGEEGIIIKNLSAPYKPGRRVGYMAKLKPTSKEFDLVIVGAEYGTGKRGGLLTSYIVACRDEGTFLEVGKVSSGLKEKEDKGLISFLEMTEILKPLIILEEKDKLRIKPKIVVTVSYQNIQKSPNYTSGYALRFPRIIALREDKPLSEVNSLEDIEREYFSQFNR
ncbi:MAG: ATP-dependent DNA ligase [Candidatus Pacearchaeota archaeon]